MRFSLVRSVRKKEKEMKEKRRLGKELLFMIIIYFSSYIYFFFSFKSFIYFFCSSVYSDGYATVIFKRLKYLDRLMPVLYSQLPLYEAVTFRIWFDAVFVFLCVCCFLFRIFCFCHCLCLMCGSVILSLTYSADCFAHNGTNYSIALYTFSCGVIV